MMATTFKNLWLGWGSIFNTQAFVEFNDGNGESVTLVGDGVVAVLGDPTLGEAVGGAGVHQTMVEAHANDRRTVGLNLLKNKIRI